jgi:hypothetical protein
MDRGFDGVSIPDADVMLFCTKATACASVGKGAIIHSPALLAVKIGRFSC